MKNKTFYKISHLCVIWLGGMLVVGCIPISTVQPQDNYRTTVERAKTGTLAKKTRKKPQKSLNPPEEATTAQPHQPSSPKKLYRPALKQSNSTTVTKEDDEHKKLKAIAK
jgi:hypothetical protein